MSETSEKNPMAEFMEKNSKNLTAQKEASVLTYAIAGLMATAPSKSDFVIGLQYVVDGLLIEDEDRATMRKLLGASHAANTEATKKYV
jgi:hypothetical protein